MADTTIGGGLDIMNRYQQAASGVNGDEFDPTINRTEAQKKYDEMYKDKTSLDFTDMLSLMVAQFQNQTMDNQASTADMMNQLTQMTSMQAMTDMVAQMKDLTAANVLSYSASLVGKTVTVGVWNETTRKLEEVVGVVEGAGTYDGQPVIYVNGERYAISSIMAVGTLPPKTEETEKPGTDPDEENKDDKVEGTPGTDPADPADPEEGEEGSDVPPVENEDGGQSQD